ncbi:MAG TPA: PAS domain-containing protein, partial [Flavisolibacter sp.]|nr:PAS domain-containing protein [Flavisolibacter sp.]
PHNYFLVPIKNDNGNVSRVLHVVQDVSKELELQLQLSERLNFIESLVEASVDRIVVLDKHMNYLYWNKKAEEFYAIAKEKVIGRNILEVFPGLRNDPGYGEFRRVLKGETIYLPPVLTNESTDYFETYLIPVKNEGAEVTAILWIVHDLRNELEMQQVKQRAAQRLEEEHRRLKEAQAIGRVGSFEWITATDAIHWSDEMYRIHRLSKNEDITLEKVFALIHPDDRDGIMEKMLRCKKELCKQTLIYRLQRADGEVRIVARELQSFADEGGHITHVSGTVQDVTEQQKAEAEARDKQELLQATMDSSQDMIQVFKAVRNGEGEIVDFTYVLLNHEAENWMPDAIGKTLLQLQPGVVEEGIFDAFKQVVESGIPQQYEKHYVHEQFDGWFYQSVVKLDDGVATTTSNITARKKAELEVRQSRTMLQTVIDAPHIGMAVYKTIRNGKGEIIDFVHEYINKASLQM